MRAPETKLSKRVHARGQMSLLAVIASGLSGWLCYQEMRRQKTHHDEAVLYEPIKDIAEANKYKVKREFPLPRAEGKLGSPEEIDFAFASASHKKYVLLEVKFKKELKRMAQTVGRDALKIRDIDRCAINKSIKDNALDMPLCGEDWTIDHAVLLVWRNTEIIDLMNRTVEPDPIRIQMLDLLKLMFDEPKDVPPKTMAGAFLGNVPVKMVNHRKGCIRRSSTFTHQRYWLAVLRKIGSWNDLKANVKTSRLKKAKTAK